MEKELPYAKIPLATVRCMKRFKKWNPSWDNIKIIGGNFQKIQDTKVDDNGLIGIFFVSSLTPFYYLRPFMKGWLFKSIDKRFVKYKGELWRISDIIDVPNSKKYADYDYSILVDWRSKSHDMVGFIDAVKRCMDSGNNSDSE
jgi:hypothetical protein